MVIVTGYDDAWVFVAVFVINCVMYSNLVDTSCCVAVTYSVRSWNTVEMTVLKTVLIVTGQQDGQAAS